ncbi:MAG TPA: porin family protein [Chitinophagaceae bacterium]|nr:porin family protein [Chitinophagaceae bacterium]
MKRIFIILSLALFCLQIPGMAQKTRVGIEAGATIANLYGKIDGVTTDYNSKGGFTAGLLIDAPIGKSRFSFRPGVSYVQKGASVNKTVDQELIWATRYANFDMTFAYQTKGAKGVTILAGLGPSVSLNLPSKKITKTRDAKTEENLVMDKESPAEIKGIDYGATGFAGLQMKNGAFLTVSYNYGIRNLIPEKDPVDELRSGCVSIKIGILLRNNK